MRQEQKASGASRHQDNAIYHQRGFSSFINYHIRRISSVVESIRNPQVPDPHKCPSRLAENPSNERSQPQHFDLPTDEPTVFVIQQGLRNRADILARLPHGVQLIDNYANPAITQESYMSELYKIDHPTVNLKDPQEQERLRIFLAEKATLGDVDGYWVYRPAWNNEIATLEHMPRPEEFAKILYARNAQAIEPEVQQRLAGMTIAVLGLSVGSNIAEALVRSGMGTGEGEIHVADKESTGATNLERLMGSATADINRPKTEVLVRRLYNINPYLNIQTYADGITHENVERFVSRADILVEVVDGFPIKHEVREVAAAYGVPVLMPTDLFGIVPLQVEKNLPGKPSELFQGRLTAEDLHKLEQGPRDIKEAAALIIKIIGFENMPIRSLVDFQEIFEGRKSTFSQPFIPCLISAGITPYYIYEIAKGNLERLQSEFVVNLEQIRQQTPQEQQFKQDFIERFGSFFLPLEEAQITSQQDRLADIPKSIRSSELVFLHGIPFEFTEYTDSTRELHFSVGDMDIRVEGIPASNLDEHHPMWQHIQEARKSYFNLWFDSYHANGTREKVSRDEFDSIDPSNSYETYHYLATIQTPTHEKRLTMRKVHYPSIADIPDEQLVEDLFVWEVFDTKTNRTQTLRQAVIEWATQHGIAPEAFSVSTISRTGTSEKTYQESKRVDAETGIGFAAIQLLAMKDPIGKLIFCTLCDEFQKDILAIPDARGTLVQPAFTRTEDVLDLGGTKKVRLQKNKVVERYKVKAGGYWVDQKGGERETLKAYEKKEITADELLNIARRIYGLTPPRRLQKDLQTVGLADKVNAETIRSLESKVSQATYGEALLSDQDAIRKIVALIMLPKNFKYIGKLMEKNSAFRERMLTHAGDGPFSSTILPDTWEQSAWNMLEATVYRYGHKEAA